MIPPEVKIIHYIRCHIRTFLYHIRTCELVHVRMRCKKIDRCVLHLHPTHVEGKLSQPWEKIGIKLDTEKERM